jgi:2-keto-4-pentenoate hydratase/2-oxohepta-3-ene-1,7-dioic acid hydratase in catechol pathway
LTIQRAGRPPSPEARRIHRCLTGAFADPPRYLRAGDVVEVDVEGVGTLTNPVHVL